MRLMIADDESMTRSSLFKLIPWYALGITEVLLACDGKDALDIAKKTPPDILLTDVRMPHINGIELAQCFAELYPRCKVLFLSGYSEKEYLFNAIRLKANAFIEKPIDPDEVAAAVLSAIQEILSEQLIEQQIIERKKLLGSAFLWNLLSRNLSEAEKNADRMNMASSYAQWSAFSVLVKNSEHGESFYEKIRVLNDEDKAFVCISEGFVHILSVDFENFCEKMIRKSLYELGVQAYIGTATCKGELSEASQIVNDSLIAAQIAYYYDKDVVDAEKVMGNSTYDCHFPKNPLSHPDEASAAISQACEELRNSGIWSIAAAKASLFKMADTIAKDALLHQVSKIPLGTNVSELWNWVNLHMTLTSAEKNLQEILRSLVKTTIGSTHIRQALIYIENNLSNYNLSNSGIACELKLNSSYFSTLFKEEMKRTVGNYITEKRMELAVSLLTMHKLRVQEIALKVGYADTAWFVKRFKQKFGMTPHEYKEKYCR